MFGAPTHEVLQKRRERWIRTRSKGKGRFILVEGVLIVFPVGICEMLLQDFAFRKPDTIDLKFIPVGLLFWLVAGYFYGRHKWNKGEEFLATTDGLS
jgi:hypothetical protein